MVSLVDLIFLLLIFFTVSATFMDQPALKLDLPEASAKPESTRDQSNMTVYLTAIGELYFADKPIKPDDLPELIKEGIKEGKSRKLIIKADREVIHGKVIEVMDIARNNGVEMITIGTKERSAGKNP